MDRKRARLLAVVAGAFPSLDTSVNVAFPAIDEHFSLDVADLQWIVVTYLFTYAVLLVPAGRLGDRYGHALLVLVGAIVSLVGVAGCAVAPTYSLFLAARVLQGMGTAMLYAGSPALLTTSADDGDRGAAVSWFQAASMIGLMIGPIVGGPLVRWIGWQSVYSYRIPIAAGLAALAALALRAERSERPIQRHEPADAAGLLALMTQPQVRRANLVNALANAAMFPVWFLVPSLLIDELGVAVIAAGFVLAAAPLLSATGSLWAGRRLTDTTDSTGNASARLGLVLLIVGLAALAGIGPLETAQPAWIVIGVALVGAGIGVFSVPNMHVVMSSLPIEHQGVAGGLSVMMRTLGVVTGVLAAGAIFDPIEAASGFDTGFRVVFALAAALAALALWMDRVSR